MHHVFSLLTIFTSQTHRPDQIGIWSIGFGGRRTQEKKPWSKEVKNVHAFLT